MTITEENGGITPSLSMQTGRAAKSLRTKCEPVTREELPEILELATVMTQHMRQKSGIGLAANQLGALKRVFVMVAGDHTLICINPQVLERSQETGIYTEGCLSFPGERIRTRRVKEITAQWMDENWKSRTAVMLGIDAVCFQHELDHLNGRTFFDRKFNGRMPRE